MTTYPKPKVGDTLFLVDVGNRARNGRGKQRPCTVTKVGRKYFTVEYYSGAYLFEVQLRLDTWQENTDYTVSYQAYPDMQAWLDEQERVQWLGRFRQEFDLFSGPRGKHSLENLREAAKVLDIELEVQQ